MNLSVLKNDRARAIRFSTLTAACDVLGCQVGDLLVVPPPGRPGAVRCASGVTGDAGRSAAGTPRLTDSHARWVGTVVVDLKTRPTARLADAALQLAGKSVRA